MLSLLQELVFELVCGTVDGLELHVLAGRSEQLSELWLQKSTDLCLSTLAKRLVYFHLHLIRHKSFFAFNMICAFWI